MTRRKLLRDTTTLSLAAALSPHLAWAATPGRIKVGQIGTAHAHASGKFSTVRKYPDVFDLVGLVEPDDRRRASAQSNKAYANTTFLTEDQLLNTPGLQAILIETAVKDLVPTASRCANFHLHLDKPAGDNLPAFRDLLSKISAAKKILQMGYVFRGNPAFQFTFNAVRQGWLGNVFEINGVIGKVISNPAERKDLAQFPGGMTFELACHLLDATLAILGKPKDVHPFLQKTGADDLADNCLAVLEWDKALATIRSAATDAAGAPRRQFSVAGTNGSLHIQPLEPPSLSLTLDRATGDFKKGSQPITLPNMPGRYDDQLLTFAKIIRGEQPLDYTPDHDLAVQETILRASGMPLT
jgi:predicted dehydrogenase